MPSQKVIQANGFNRDNFENPELGRMVKQHHQLFPFYETPNTLAELNLIEKCPSTCIPMCLNQYLIYKIPDD